MPCFYYDVIQIYAEEFIFHSLSCVHTHYAEELVFHSLSLPLSLFHAQTDLFCFGVIFLFLFLFLHIYKY